MRLSAVILAMTNTEKLFRMTSNCINSLIASEKDIEMEIIIIESNKKYFNSDFIYPNYVKVIVPESEFNFHKFLNIGIEASTGDYIALCNNDLIFYENWFSAIIEVANKNKDILSFSPTGTPPLLNENEEFSLGYKVRTHINGWCIVVKRALFDKIGFLDEAFDFYFADNDYAMTLKVHNVKHARIHNSHVVHLEKKSTLFPVLNDENSFLKQYKIPNYLWNEEYKWVMENERSLSGFLNFHEKWGSPVLYHRKNKIADFLISCNLGFLNKYVLK